MKTTLMFRQMIANPRRTTLAHLADASELRAQDGAVRPGADGVEDEAARAAAVDLPQRTANPRRTVLTELPKAPVAP